MNLCLLIPILTGVVSALLGYLLGKLSTNDHTADVELWKTRYIAVEEELARCRSQLTVEATEGGNVPAFDAGLAGKVLERSIAENDLQVVEGIGPKVEALFRKHGITTWKKLAETSVARCREILDSEDGRFRTHDPETWHEQARLAYEGKWEKLRDWQKNMKGGRL